MSTLRRTDHAVPIRAALAVSARSVLRGVVTVAIATLWSLLALSGCGVSYPNCSNDSNCREHHEVCVDTHCQQCRVSSDCGGGKTCLRNRCLEGEHACERDTDCTGDQTCQNHQCAARPECDDTRSCGRGQACQAGRCIAAYDPDSDPVDNQGRQCTFQPVYFAQDTVTLDEPARTALQFAADCLQRERDTRYVLIGRSDPRGTTEYNFALGERRAREAQRYLLSLGIVEARVLVSSEGSERAQGTDEPGWAHDRRVDFRPRDW